MRMPIAYAINDGYTKILMAQLIALYENAHADTIYDLYILNYQLKSDNRTLISNLVISLHGDAKVTFLDVSEDEYQQLPGLSTWGREANFRSLLPRFLPEMDRILYLDADTFVLMDLSHLMHLELDKYAYAAAMDVDNHNQYVLHLAQMEENMRVLPKVLSFDYINSGVMLINLRYWREHNWINHFIRLLQMGVEEKIIIYPDQDVFNYLAIMDGANRIYYLPASYNHHTNAAESQEKYSAVVNFQKNNILDLSAYSKEDFMAFHAEVARRNHSVQANDLFVKDAIAIIHFCGNKPWSRKRDNNTYVALFTAYAKRVGLEMEPRRWIEVQFNKLIWKLKTHYKLVLLGAVFNLFTLLALYLYMRGE